MAVTTTLGRPAPNVLLADIAGQAAGLGYRLLPMTAADEAVLRAMAALWDAIQASDIRVPAVVFDLTPGRDSSCIGVGWDQPAPILQVNLIRDGQTIGPDALLEWLLHQAAHAISGPVTASEGRFHADTYREAAVSLGLDVTRRTSGGSGWNITTLARGTKTRYRTELDKLGRALARWEPTAQVAATRTSRNPPLAACSCTPPRKIRASTRTLSHGDIVCSICGQPFRPAR